MHNIKINEDQNLLNSLTKACKIRNDKLKLRLPIHKQMLHVILNKIDDYFMKANQPYLALLYQTLFSTTYYGLLRVSEVTSTESNHAVLAKDLQIADNKRKILLILRSSKTHGKNMHPQLVKISSTRKKNSVSQDESKHKFCPYNLLRRYFKARGGYRHDTEQFFTFRDGSPVTAYHFNFYLKLILRKCGFQNQYYGTHSLKAGRSSDLFKLGLPIEKIKKLGRWKSNAIYRYLKL